MIKTIKQDSIRWEQKNAARGSEQFQKMSLPSNDYFLPGEGISREVITADITRYLGNDALVRPYRMPDVRSSAIPEDTCFCG
jgi:hypothetical protein